MADPATRTVLGGVDGPSWGMANAEESYESTVRDISDAIVEAQSPIRILNAIKWDDPVRDAFFASAGREQPDIDADWYAGRDLGFDLDQTRERFLDLELQINASLGTTSGVAQLLKRTCEPVSYTHLTLPTIYSV